MLGVSRSHAVPFRKLRELLLKRREAGGEKYQERDNVIERALRSRKQYRRPGERSDDARDHQTNDAAPLVPQLLPISERAAEIAGPQRDGICDVGCL